MRAVTYYTKQVALTVTIALILFAPIKSTFAEPPPPAEPVVTCPCFTMEKIVNKAKLHPYCESDIWQDMPYYSKPNSIYMDTQKKQANEYHTHLESRDGGGGEPTSTCGIRLSKEYDDHYWMPHYTKFAIITHAEHWACVAEIEAAHEALGCGLD